MTEDAETVPPAQQHERSETAALRRHQALIVVLLFLGYAAYYFCRADLAVATPLLVEELQGRGFTAQDALVRIGGLSSVGGLAYALGKFFLGGLGDFWGGRRSFLIGLGGATLFTLMFVSGGTLPIFTMAWIGNRLTQSIGWAGLLKVCSRWFNYSSYGSIIGILSVSYFAGDVVARQSMGALIQHGYGWRTLFYFAAAVAAALLVANVLWLRESRADIGHAEAEVNPQNLFAGTQQRPTTIGEFLKPLFFSPAFVLVCLLSFGCTVVRETFNIWTPQYLHSFVGYSVGRAGSLSAIFPLFGIASVLATGWLSDRLGANGRSIVLCLGLVATVLALFLLAGAPAGVASATVPLTLIGAVAFCLLGPYSYLGGAFALDFGGKQAGAVSSGIIDGVGYLGSVLAGDTVARISGAYGWQGAFVALASVSAVSAVAAGVLYFQQRRHAGRGAS